MTRDYSSKDFTFDVPDDLIAQAPPAIRGTSRLMNVDRSTGSISDHRIPDLPGLLPERALLVFNDSRVRKARIHAASETGGSVEMLLIEPVDEAQTRWKTIVSKAKRQRIGRRYRIPGGAEAELVSDEPPYKVIEVSMPLDEPYFEEHGHVPLPPYIRRSDRTEDQDRYQTVYASESHTGSAAAPTAGLHFTPELIERFGDAGIEIAYVTLHVGIGTFLPIRTDLLDDHRMHEERYEISADVAERINRAKVEGRQVVAVGTTVVRSLESAAQAVDSDGQITPGTATTDLFIRPGYEFLVVDGMVTNFHTPESTLIVMVSAFAGYDLIRTAYREAIARKYRFFSYGDAMLIV